MPQLCNQEIYMMYISLVPELGSVNSHSKSGGDWNRTKFGSYETNKDSFKAESFRLRCPKFSGQVANPRRQAE